jgi:hypothetical protein
LTGVIVLGAGAGLTARHVLHQPELAEAEPPATPVGADQVKPGDSPPPPAPDEGKAPQAKIKNLKDARLEAARKAFDAMHKEFLAGKGILAFTMDWSKRLLKAELDVFDKPADRLAARQRYLARCREFEEVLKKLFEAGRVQIQDYLAAQFERLEAEIDVAEHQKENPPAK